VTGPLLEIADLQVTFSTRRGRVEAVRGITLSLQPGEMLGLVGESGSGKSVTGFAVTGLLDKAGRITKGRILFRGQDVTKASAAEFRDLHGAAMAMIFQNPRAALNPIRTVGAQISDAILAHRRLSRRCPRLWICCAPFRSAIRSAARTPIRMSSRAACASA
jgi:peptide/nickel transport system ATP-binding protein